jgi:hypothetical protein
MPLKTLKIKLPYDPATPLLGIYLKECKSGYNKGTCTPMVFYSIIHNSSTIKIAKMSHY